MGTRPPVRRLTTEAPKGLPVNGLSPSTTLTTPDRHLRARGSTRFRVRRERFSRRRKRALDPLPGDAMRAVPVGDLLSNGSPSRPQHDGASTPNRGAGFQAGGESARHRPLGGAARRRCLPPPRNASCPARRRRAGSPLPPHRTEHTAEPEGESGRSSGATPPSTGKNNCPVLELRHPTIGHLGRNGTRASPP